MGVLYMWGVVNDLARSAVGLLAFLARLAGRVDPPDIHALNARLVFHRGNIAAVLCGGRAVLGNAGAAGQQGRSNKEGKKTNQTTHWNLLVKMTSKACSAGV